MKEAYCLVRFKQSYILSPDCIGRKISICFSDTSLSPEKIECTILFPCKHPKDQYRLVSPIPEKILGVVYDWGKVDYSEPNYIPHVNGVVVILRSKDKLSDTKVRKFIDYRTNRLLKTLRCKYPYAVNRDSVRYPYAEETIVKSNNIILAVSINIIFDKEISKKWIELSGVINAIRHLNEEVSLPLQLFDDALESQSSLDYRKCVLNCAILIEVLLKRNLEKQIDIFVSSTGLKKRIMKRANGYSKIIDYLKDLSMVPSIDAKGLFDTRNRIMHGGYSPTEVESQEYLNIASKYIDYFKVELYERPSE